VFFGQFEGFAPVSGFGQPHTTPENPFDWPSRTPNLLDGHADPLREGFPRTMGQLQSAYPSKLSLWGFQFFAAATLGAHARKREVEKTWASGAVELLRHAHSHINLESAFDRRIAFISIDNAIETMIRTFLALPKSKSGISVSRKQVEEAEKSFPLLLEMFWSNVGSRLTGIVGYRALSLSETRSITTGPA
jgi:hypothetical protein